MSINSEFKILGESYKNSLSSDFSKNFSYRVKKGMGITIGNSLRRTLLGQIPGYAIRYFEINNINHEFTSVSGMKESFQTLIMNLRKIIFKSLSNEKRSGKASLTIKNIEGEIFASSIQSAEFEIINPDIYLCSLNKDSDLKVDMYIEKGVGYILASNVSSFEYGSEAIICDSFFSPIEEVNFSTDSIENNNMEEELFISIKTNGSITPDNAMDQTIIIWRDELAKISCKMIEVSINDEISSHSYSQVKVHNAYLDARIKNIPDMTSRIISCLDTFNIEYVGQLVTMTEDDLLQQPNFGQGSLKQLSQILNNIGLSLGMKLDNWRCPDIKNEDYEEVLIG